MSKATEVTIEEFERFMEENLAAAIKDPDITGFKAETKVKSNGKYRILSPVYSADEGHVFPVIYTENFYKKYKVSGSVKKVMDEIVSFVEQDKAPEDLVESVLELSKSFEKAKDKLALQLINPERNSKYLENVPYISCFENLAAIAIIVLSTNGSCMRKSVVTDIMLKNWGVTKEELFEEALKNNAKIFTAQITPMKEILLETIKKNMKNFGMSEEMILDCLKETEHDMDDDLPMVVVTNDRMMYGASAALSLETLKAAAEGCGANDKMIILPSSIHEIICMPVMENMTKENLMQIVCEVNRQEVSDEEYLSDSVYLYDVNAGTVTVWK